MAGKLSCELRILDVVKSSALFLSVCAVLGFVHTKLFTSLHLRADCAPFVLLSVSNISKERRDTKGEEYLSARLTLVRIRRGDLETRILSMARSFRSDNLSTPGI